MNAGPGWGWGVGTPDLKLPGLLNYRSSGDPTPGGSECWIAWACLASRGRSTLWVTVSLIGPSCCLAGVIVLRPQGLEPASLPLKDPFPSLLEDCSQDSSRASHLCWDLQAAAAWPRELPIGAGRGVGREGGSGFKSPQCPSHLPGG